MKQTIAEAHVRLQQERYVALEEEFINVAEPEDLRLQDRAMFEAAKGLSIGVCARCRYTSGCQSCDEAKAWSYACRSTLWHPASEDMRPKSKPKERPNKNKRLEGMGYRQEQGTAAGKGDVFPCA